MDLLISSATPDKPSQIHWTVEVSIQFFLHELSLLHHYLLMCWTLFWVIITKYLMLGSVSRSKLVSFTTVMAENIRQWSADLHHSTGDEAERGEVGSFMCSSLNEVQSHLVFELRWSWRSFFFFFFFFLVWFFFSAGEPSSSTHIRHLLILAVFLSFACVSRMMGISH